MSSSSAESQSGRACCSCSMSRATIACLRSSIRLRRRWSRARRLAVTISQAPGFSGTPVAGHCSRAASNASCVNSSASGTSRRILARLVISRGCSIRQTARIVRLTSASVMATDCGDEAFASRASKRANLARPFPARHEVLVELHKFDGGRNSFFLVSQLKDGIATDDLLGLDKWAIHDAKLSIRYPNLCACGDGHPPATVEHGAGLDLPVGELVHRLHKFRSRSSLGAG